MTNMGTSSEFLGIRIKRNREEKILTLTQSGYVDKMLEKFGFFDLKPQNTPMITSQVSNKERKRRENENSADELEEVRKETPYREAVGSLLYLANATRPDISYAVNVISRHQINPTDSDWNLVKRIFRYIKGTRASGLMYKGKSTGLAGFSDASFADCNNSLTTSGYLIKLYGDTVGWRTHRQTSVALSTCQAEYVALSEACQELLSVYNSLHSIIEAPLTPMVLWCDNVAAITNAETTGGGKLRHMCERKEHYVKECVKRNMIKVQKIDTKNQLADILTKPLAYIQHDSLTKKILNTD